MTQLGSSPDNKGEAGRWKAQGTEQREGNERRDKYLGQTTYAQCPPQAEYFQEILNLSGKMNI